MAVTLSDPVSGTSIPLYNATELRDERAAALNTTPITGFDAAETFLASLEQSETVDLTGTATGQRLASESAFSSDPETALAEWAAALETFVNGGQGDGYELSRDYRGDTFNGVIEAAAWTRSGGAPLELRWNLSFIRGSGAGVETSPSIPSVTPGGQYRLDSFLLDAVGEFRVEKSQSFEVYRRAFADDAGDNDLFSEAGATKRVTVVGTVPGDEATRQTFDSTVTSSLGQDEVITVRDALTGRTFDGMLDSYEATDEAGITRFGDYAFEFVVGGR